MKEDEIVRPFDRHCNETVTLNKHITKYKFMRKWLIEFLRKFENRGKIARVNSIPITKSINLQLFTITFRYILNWMYLKLYCFHVFLLITDSPYFSNPEPQEHRPLCTWTDVCVELIHSGRIRSALAVAHEFEHRVDLLKTSFSGGIVHPLGVHDAFTEGCVHVGYHFDRLNLRNVYW